MPLKLIPPRPGKTPYWSVRGTHLGRYLDRSAKTADEAVARKLLRKWAGEIERGELAVAKGPTFMTAAHAYLTGGGDPRFLGSYDEQAGKWSGLIGRLGDMQASEIGQEEIDDAARALYPNASPATRNRQVHAVVSVILKRAGFDFAIRRPAGATGKPRTVWLTPEQAFALICTTASRDLEFGAFVTTLIYTGMRLSEALALKVDDVDLSSGFAYLPATKNGEPRGVYLPPIVVTALANHPRGMQRPKQRVFRFTKCGRIYTWLDDAVKAAGIELPARSAFHVLRHTWATWMRRYGGLDTRGLVGTGAWKDAKSARRYEHVVATEEARRADLLPTPGSKPGGKSVERKPKMLKGKAS